MISIIKLLKGIKGLQGRVLTSGAQLLQLKITLI